MYMRRLRKSRFLPAVLLLVPVIANAQNLRDVMVLDNEFDPETINIQTGDTVRWVDFADFSNLHDVVSDDGLWTPREPADGWTFSHQFNEPGTFGYFCSVHPEEQTGVVNVTGEPIGGVDFNAGHNGNWWNGPARSGEGVQLELADAGSGELVFVATIYTYGPLGGQIFLIAVAIPIGDTAEVDVFITEGPVWGDGFDPGDVSKTQWGTGVFTSTDCDKISMLLTPNADYMSLGYTVLEYDLVRLTSPSSSAPMSALTELEFLGLA